MKREVLIVSTEERHSGTLWLNHNEENNRFLAARGKQAQGSVKLVKHQ